MKIALIAPASLGSAAIVLRNLVRGLVSEGIHVDLIRLRKRKFHLLSIVRDDILSARHHRDYDLALYIGGIPWPSHVLAKLSGVPVALFLHSYVYHDLLNVMLYRPGLRNKIGGAVIPIMMLRTATSLNTVDLYVCHSLAACEANKISNRFVVLPQWIFPEELELLKQQVKQQVLKNNIVRIVTYTSNSPRLLNANHLVALARLIERKVDRRFELIIVDSSKEYNISLGSVRIMRTIPHKDFLSLLASADLYIERCIDEELGITSFEAIAMGVPIVKLTHPRYWDRQDYKEDLILVRSFRELADKIAEYINNIDHYYHYYSKRCREFVLTKRTWDAVKEPFLSALKHISRQK